jgi:uracil-DNA glycosylase
MNWKDFISEEMKKDYFKEIDKTLKIDSKKYVIYPPKEQIFRAFDLCPIENIKVVLLGQDVYYNPGQANGLSFSVSNFVRIPPSLQNIFKELKSDLGYEIQNHGNLENWARQGALLLNCALTVRQGEPTSHSKIWEPFSDNVIQFLNGLNKPLVYILMGAHAKSKLKFITNKKHHIICSSHASPLAANQGGFFGVKHFSKTNDFLISNGVSPIDWKLKSI